MTTLYKQLVKLQIPFSHSVDLCASKRENVCFEAKIINWILKRRKSFDNPFFSSSSRCLPNICLKKSHKKWGERKKITSFVVSALTNKLRTSTHTAHKIKRRLLSSYTTNADFALIKHLTKDSGQSLITYAIKSHHNTRSSIYHNKGTHLLETLDFSLSCLSPGVVFRTTMEAPTDLSLKSLSKPRSHRVGKASKAAAMAAAATAEPWTEAAQVKIDASYVISYRL